MRSPAYNKSILREIRHSLGRFIAIVAIVALGVGFLAGLLSTTPDMKISIDEFYKQSNTADIFIKGSMGLSEEDLAAVQEIPEVGTVMPSYVTDILMDSDLGETLVARIYGLPLEDMEQDRFINKPTLLSGRLPQNENECLVERSTPYFADIPLGTVLTISETNADYDEIDDTYGTLSYTVVGIVSNPFYLAKERETSSLGYGRLDTILYVYNSCYNLDVYTDFYLTLANDEEHLAFSDDYDTYVEQVTEQLEAIAGERSRIRRAEILETAETELADAKSEYEEAAEEVNAELLDAWRELQDGRQELADALTELEEGEQDLEEGKQTLAQEIADAEQKIADGKLELADALVELEDGEKQLADGQQELEAAKEEWENGQAEYEDGLAELADAKEQLEDGEAELDEAKALLDAGQTEYEAGLQQYESNADAFNQLTGQIAQGMGFSSGTDMLEALEQDSSGTLAQGINTALNQSRAGLDSQIQNVEGQREDLGQDLEQMAALIAAIQNGQAEPPEGQSLASLQSQYQAGQGTYQQLGQTIASLQAQRDAIPADAAAIQSAGQELSQGKEELDEARAELDQGWQEYYEGLEEWQAGQEEYEEGAAQLEEAAEELAEGQEQIEEGEQEIAKSRQELDDGWQEYYQGLADIEEAEQTLPEEKAKAEQEIAEAEADLAEGWREYEKGRRELLDGETDYYSGKEEAEQELADAAQEIADAEAEIADLGMPKWYVLDRNSTVSYASLAMNVEKVNDIAKIFPVFFFLVAALVALTTMTRMVEEERIQIGTLKALGYSKGAIMRKYLIYCGAATLLGCLLGLLGGFQLLPIVIWNAYGSLYSLPELQTIFNWKIGALASLGAILCTMGATYSACNLALKEKPALLMLPRAPKPGKRILLERLPFIWSKLKFNYKATARNIFRYKKHLFMTIIGVAGCTALLVAGFGLRDAIDKMVERQYTDIFHYDLTLNLQDAGVYADIQEKFLEDADQVESYLLLYSESVTASSANDDVTVTLYVPKQAEELDNFISVLDYKTGEPLPLETDAVIITEMVAKELHISIGDTLQIEDTDEQTGNFQVTGIAENYVGSYIYIHPQTYRAAFPQNEASNAILACTHIEGLAEQDQALTWLLSRDNVFSAEFIGQSRTTLDNLITSLGFIVLVLVFAAGGLAVIVLYNLTNININERKKELATLRVLGFHHREVGGYIFREIVIMTLMGALLGLVLGKLLHSFVVSLVENPVMMFSHYISPWTYLLSLLITLLFSVLVDWLMYQKIKRIKMAESMKAND